ncbi:MAG: hypothetical protein V2A54_13275 [Bacteroidota bacterium]
MNVSRGNKIRRIVFSAIVTEAGQIIKINKKLPSYIKRCTGMYVTIKGYYNTFNEVLHAGELSLLLNAGQVHPLHFRVGYSRIPLMPKNTFLEADENLIANQPVSGYYRDMGTMRSITDAFLPYTLNIYLECRITE